MHCCEAERNRAACLQSLLARERALIPQALFQGRAENALHHIVGAVLSTDLGNPRVEDRDEIGMEEGARGPHLAGEAREKLRLVRNAPRARVDHLDRHKPVELGIVGVVHDAHSAPPELAADSIAIDRLREIIHALDDSFAHVAQRVADAGHRGSSCS
jgi:hypothetical protein